MSTYLNEMQQKIVQHTEGAVMVLAGAGSGKTRVLTNRIQHILTSGLARESEILAITFTNKAANEIKQRLIDNGVNGGFIWALTFHSMCCKILRAEASKIDGYSSNFSIYDEQDKKNTIKKILKENNLKEEDYLQDVSSRLSKLKISNLSLAEYEPIACSSPHDKALFELMKKYENRLKQNNAMDFDDLINKTLYLLKTNEEVRQKYQEKFRYILVDEFQDTNETQYNLVKILAGYHQNIFAVGDEDQNIYSWRGASVNNIKRFLKDFSNATLYKLEQNYRSTKTIVDYANRIIKNNKNRIDKTLFTENMQGDIVTYNKSNTDRDEAEYVVNNIIRLVAMGYKRSDIAVLMRLNALSRNFEEKLINYGVPYKLFGGLKFYERAEIKNIMAYLKLIVNNQDEESFYRIINFPKRGIGDGAISKLKETSFGMNLVDAVMMLPDSTTGILAKFIPFKKLMKDLIEKSNELELYEFVEYLINTAGIKNAYNENTEEDTSRLLNISEFLQNVKQYAHENSNKNLVDFLQTVSLTTDIDSYEENNDNVILATVHSVKGLEFKVVFVVGLEEKYFPIIRLDDSEDELEEERRLMYVAITRAKEKLFLTCSKTRYKYGEKNYLTVSRFIKELGYENRPSLNERTGYNERTSYSDGNNFGAVAEQSGYNSRPTTFGGSLNSFMHRNIETTKKETDFALGDRVFHSKFGVGYIEYLDIKTSTVRINFDNFGNKVLSLQFAPIKKM